MPNKKPKKKPDLSALLRRVAKKTGRTEAEIFEDIENVVNLLAPGFVFGYFDIDDIKQEATTKALTGLARYDCSRPLPNFVYSHVKNQLINFKRDNFHRNDPPCEVCHRACGNTTEHADGSFCPKYLAWKKLNGSKAGIARPVGLDQVAEDEQGTGDSVPDDVGMKELLGRIDAGLSVDLRQTYLQMRAGVAVPRERRLEVETAVREILGDV